MTCTNNPMDNIGEGRSGLLDRLGIGNIWDWLRDFLAGVFFRADLYDGQNHPYLGIGRDYQAAPDIVDSTDTSKLTVPDIANAEPDTHQPQDDPGISLYFSSYPEWQYSGVGGWTIKEYHQEIVVKALINGNVRYGRIPLWAVFPAEGSLIDFQYAGYAAAPTWDAGTPQNTVNLLWARSNAAYDRVRSALDLLEKQGVIRGYMSTTPG